MKKVLKKLNIDTGVTLVNGNLTVYGLLTAEAVPENYNPFSFTAEDATESVYTFAYIDPEDESNIEIVGKLPEFDLDDITKYPTKLKELLEKTYNLYIDSKSDILKHHIHIDSNPSIDIYTTEKSIDVLVNDIKTEYTELKKFKKKLSKINSTSNIKGYLDIYFFKEHLMLVGERGASKTYTVSKYLKDKGIETEFMGCHNAVEAIDLLGYYIKAHDGSFVWLDGALSAAFRKAQAGTKIALFMDEILRMPAKELNILVAALTPDSESYFNLRTNRIVNQESGVGEVELLRVPKDMLWVIATTNIGADYDVEDIDIAFQDRFITIDVKLDNATIKSILKQYTKDPLIVRTAMETYNRVENAFNLKELSHKLNVRHLVKAVSYANDDKEDLLMYLKHFTPNVCSRDINGELNKIEVQLYTEILNSI